MTKTPNLALSAAIMGNFRLAKALVEAGALTQAQAAKAMAEASEDMRSLSEDDPWAKDGETIARMFEQTSAWLLGHEGTIPGKDDEAPRD